MIVFNFDIEGQIHVETTSEETVIRFGEQGLYLNPASTGSGYSITNDWNDRHFTIGFDDNSVLYHLTREDINDSESGKGDMKPEEFIAELYGYIRWLAPPVPEDRIDLELVGMVDSDAVREYLQNENIVESTEQGITIEPENQADLFDKFEENPEKMGQLLGEVLESIAFNDIRDSGEIIFVRPHLEGVTLLFLYPDGYVGIADAETLFQRLNQAGGSQIIDHLLRSVGVQKE